MLKKNEVEDHPRISSFSNKTKSISACADSLKSKTSNAKVVCVTYGKCLVNSNHDAYVSNFINDVNARTKKHKENDLLTVTHGSDHYTIALQESSSPTPMVIMNDIVNGLPKLKYVKDQMCSSCQMGKAKRIHFKTKIVLSSKGRLHLLHMYLCGLKALMEKIHSGNVDAYSRYTWTYFLRSKNETSKVLIEFQRGLQDQVINVRTDRGTKFLNKTFQAYFKEKGLSHQMTIARTPEHNSIVER
uniref:Integrase catalytic domain-containing protein n=1 Tax=Tanacetum cinerariifolium TaxID=118510 RepID=A0A699KMY8_TANCI|nr:hypothetical protein [Tanacetum cinerariifolium]GFB01441.1 hypothetical protein [Tanacetum cinerariifolium]